MTNELTDVTTEKLLKGIKIPPQPQLMVDLQMEMAMPNVTLAQIATIISKDIGISGATLKVINSPYFAMRSKITSIHQALSLLGIQNIVNIVNCLSLRNAFSYHDLMAMTKVWDNSMDVAMTCSAVAKLTGIASADEAYTLGLFHDSGVTLLMNKFASYPEVLKRAYQERDQRITDIENSAIETNHAVVGYFVAKAWMLPDILSRAIADHHKAEPIFADEIAYDSRSKNLLAILKVAENTCHSPRALADTENHHEFNRIKRNLLVYLGMSEYDFDDLQAEVRDLLINCKF